MSEFQGKHIVVLGLALEGVSLARFLSERGGRVLIVDDADADALRDRTATLPAGIDLQLGASEPSLVDDADLLFVSPGVPERNPLYAQARELGIPIRSMTTLFFDLCPGPIVGVTGSSGKTTTTALIGHVLQTAGREVVVGGNIGKPMLDLLPEISADTIVILELSSFQLEILERSPHIAVVTNISPNHLDRHPDMEAYVAAKLNVVSHQSPMDYAVLNASDDYAEQFQTATCGAVRWFGSRANGSQAATERMVTVRDGVVRIQEPDTFRAVIDVGDVPLLGPHNVENVLAAVTVADILGIDECTMAEAIKSFSGLPHRLQIVCEREGVRYIDDSIATSPARAAAALRAIEGPVLLIAGGRDKKLPWEEFADLVAKRCRAVFLIGEAAGDIERAIRRARLPRERLDSGWIRHCGTLEEAVSLASRIAQPGETILLSPACASYDMFRNFEERGRVFARAAEHAHAA